jgi:adenosylcobinamide-phosphate synthase
MLATALSFLVDSTLILLIALLIDTLLGEVPDKIHPTVWMGNVIRFLKPRIRNQNPTIEKVNGVLLALFVMAIFAVAAFLIVFWVRQWFGWLPYIVVSAVLLKMTFAARCMSDYTKPIARAVEKDNVAEAKRLLPYIVRRDPSTLSEEHVISAAVESIAESTTDGVTSPFFYFALFGVAGAFAYRVVNTLDSMVGYKDKMNVNIGWFSANLDTILNYIPTRLTGLLMVLSAALLSENWRGSLKILQRDRRNMTSVNAGWTIGAMAGALSVQLEKPGYYKLGDGGKLTPNHIGRALEVMYLTIVLFVIIVLIPVLFLKGLVLSTLAIGWLF